ncbi:methionine--tRNA ligase [Candidatus Uhrbacteria bacterium]|nr:methionine--tRNA ligase [Candidatus Uhrbacteria bacterium]
MKPSYYITTTLPYVNAEPHIGTALEFVQADVLARFHRLRGEDVVFNTGTDEHGLKIWKQAVLAGMDPKAYCDQFASKFHGLKETLALSYTHFIRTTDPHHVTAAQEFWKRCDANGDIYKARYVVKYCVGCELEKTESELVDGRCPIHPSLEIERRDEENYFFRWSKYQRALLTHYDAHPDFVMPKRRFHEIRTFVEDGLQDFSISRLTDKMPWGIPVPGDDAHVMYVWFDALVNYVSTLGWPSPGDFERFWPGVQIAGKDNLRQQSAMWQAMLASAGLPLSKQIFIHGFITADGQKMSKSLGNVVNPYDLVARYGTDAVRYFLLGGIPSSEDGDFSTAHFEELYTSKLVNGTGNLAARVTAMIEKFAGGAVPEMADDRFATPQFWKTYTDALDSYRFDETVRALERYVASMNQAIDVEAPFKKAKDGADVGPFMAQLAEALRHVGIALLPLVPATAEQILRQLSVDPGSVRIPEATAWGMLPAGHRVVKGDILFPRLPS